MFFFSFYLCSVCAVGLSKFALLLASKGTTQIHSFKLWHLRCVTFPVGQWSQVSTQSQNQSRTLAENQQNHIWELKTVPIQFETKQNIVCHLVPQNTPHWVPRYCKSLSYQCFKCSSEQNGFVALHCKTPLVEGLGNVNHCQCFKCNSKQGLSPCTAKYPSLSA